MNRIFFFVILTIVHLSFLFTEEVICTKCAGVGSFFETNLVTCLNCNGNGKIKIPEDGFQLSFNKVKNFIVENSSIVKPEDTKRFLQDKWQNATTTAKNSVQSLLHFAKTTFEVNTGQISFAEFLQRSEDFLAENLDILEKSTKGDFKTDLALFKNLLPVQRLQSALEHLFMEKAHFAYKVMTDGRGKSLNGEPIYYINGIYTTLYPGSDQESSVGSAIEEAKLLAEKLQRPVWVIYNPSILNPKAYHTGTPNVGEDLGEAIYDRIWPMNLSLIFNNFGLPNTFTEEGLKNGRRAFRELAIYVFIAFVRLSRDNLANRQRYSTA